MRPDEHKAKDSRRYQQRKKQAGDTSAAEVADARKKAARARDRGAGIAAIRRRNGDYTETEEEAEERKQLQAKFSRRKLQSNADRYEEETEQDMLERDAELGIDRETTDLVSMLENEEEGSSTFFKFKDEKLFNTDSITSTNDMMNRNMLQLDFNMFEKSLQALDTDLLLGLEDETELVESILNDHPVVLDKPIVPSFSKNAKGYVLFKQQQPAKPNIVSEVDGIYLRNDGSNHRVIPKQNTQAKKEPEVAMKDQADDLDELLALDQQPKATKPSSAPSAVATSPPPPVSASAPAKKPSLPRPGSIKKPVTKDKAADLDDEAWLDDILG